MRAMERLAVVAKLRTGAEARAAEIVRHGPPFDPGEHGFSRHAVYLTAEHAIFVFEGDAADASVRELLDDPLRSNAFARWAPLLDGVPQLAPEGYYWKRTG
jgi:hypothetical protein